MLMDHRKAASDLEEAAAKENIDLPDGLDKEHSDKLTALSSAIEADFDQAYLSTQVVIHEEAIRLFTSFAADGRDGPIKNFATATLGTLRMHAIKVHGLTDNK